MGKPNHLNWDEAAGAAPNARRRLPGLVSAFFARGRELLPMEPKSAEWHALRLATKRLRYTLELFRPCYGPGFRTRLAALRRLQQSLGEVNACARAAEILAAAFAGKSPQRARVEHFLRHRGAAKTEEFRREWTQVFDAPGQERWWTGYLAQRARPPERKAGGRRIRG